jgi:hypothetical protein
MKDDSNDTSGRNDDFKWRLLSVLFSTHPLSSSLARILFDAAWNLYRTDAANTKISTPLVQGKIENLRRDMMLGTIGGPAFEATIDTERGSGTVRFIITRQGLQFMAELLPASEKN